MKINLSVISYVAYLLVISTTSFLFYWVFKIWIAMGRFTATDAPPGDIGATEKVFYSFVIPIGYFVIMTLLSFVFRRYLKKYSVNLKKTFILAINVLITVYLITQFKIFSFS
ncbi:hypothetical protein J45TS6_40300 [Paenibacillus sp. J45TS6]|nr:hypothetical protein J45TS6_40300 [Paenibacillus sp. J45TS6]